MTNDDRPLPQPASDVVRTTLGVLFIGALIVACLWVLGPFLAATVWAAMVVVSTWPVMLWLQARLWNRRGLAVTVMTLLMLLLFVAPLTLAIGTIVEHADLIVAKVSSLAQSPLPEPPAWVAGLPMVGERIVETWDAAVASGATGLLAKLAPYANDILKWLVSHAGSVGFLFMQFLLTVAISALMYASGEVAADAVRRFGRRLAGSHGDAAVTLGGQAIRSVALGVGVTAIVQAGLGGIGLAIAGIPFAGLFAAVMLLMCIAQLGPSLVLFPAVAWLYWSGDNGWGTFLLVWSIIVATMDNVLRPALIKRGADLPLVLIFAGVIGGLFAFGLLGIFVGPVVLAVAYTLLGSWIGDGTAPRPTPEATPPPASGAG